MLSIVEAPRRAAALHASVKVAVFHSEPLIAIGIASALCREHGIEAVSDRLEGDVLDEFDVVIADYAAALSFVESAPRANNLAILATRLRECEVQHALELGIRGYVLRTCPLGELVQCVRMVAAGSRFLSRDVSACIAGTFARAALTAREIQVLELLSRGSCNKTISRRLDVALGTTKAHIKSIFAKLDVSSRTEAALVAVRRGLVTDQ
jgi:DNA-binding NarL/FixJ family response regulator